MPLPPPTGPRDRPAHAMAVVTMVCLVLAAAYSAVFGADGWLWLAWTGLALSTTALFLTGA